MRSVRARGGWTLRRRLSAAIGVGGILILGTALVAAILVGRMQRTQDRVVDDLFMAYRLSQSVFVVMLDAETAVRAYALTGDPELLEPFENVDPATRGDFQRVRALLRDEPAAGARLEAFGNSARVWQQEWAVPTVERVRADGAGSISATRSAVGKDLFDDVRADHATFVQELIAVRELALDELHREVIALFSMIALAAIVTVGVAAGLWVTLRSWVTAPAERLAEESRQVADGELDHEVTLVGPPEFRALAADVEGMRHRLVRQLGEVERGRAQIEKARVQLEAQAEELRRSNVELEQFAYVASHDLQEPLRKVASFCQLLERRYKGQLDARADQYIAFAVDGAKRMQLLINDLLAFSRVGRSGSSPTPVELEAALARAIANLGAAIEQEGAIITHDPLPVVTGEALLLTQLFQNLLGNAVKFHGGEPPRVHIGVRDAGDSWEFACSDNGIGIDEQYAEKVFVIFQRLHAKETYEGTGIGLALCKKIVEHHGGHIWLDREVSTGTTLRWTLPKRASTVGGNARSLLEESAVHA